MAYYYSLVGVPCGFRYDGAAILGSTRATSAIGRHFQDRGFPPAMQKLIALILTLFLAGCAFPGVYKINVQQGNIVTEKELTALTEGMPRSQVHAVMGTPLMLNPVDTSQEYYVYTFQRAGGDIEEQRIIVYYDDDRFSHYEAQLLEETPAY
jgi:outer membrane protein assembly factor BamE